jgi:hypothetical protein
MERGDILILCRVKGMLGVRMSFNSILTHLDSSAGGQPRTPDSI